MKAIKLSLLACALGLTIAISGCSKKEKTIGGVAIGAATGALIGSAAGGTGGGIAGAAVGGILGGVIGHSLGDDKDKKKKK